VKHSAEEVEKVGQALLTHRTELRETDFSGIYKLARFQKIFMKMDKSTSLTSG